jgi:DNA polymerase IV
MTGGDPVRYLFLDLNSYFASVEQQTNPKLRGKPVAVTSTRTDATCAIAASYEAKAFGVKTGTMIYEARKLCPGLITVTAHHELYVEYHHKVMDAVERVLPIETVHSIDEAACRLIGAEQKVANALRLARAIKRAIARDAGDFVKCSIGLAVNSYLAKVATDLEKPDGLVVLPLGELPGRILHFTLTDLPWIGRSMERRLKAAGVSDVAALWNLSAMRMRQIWGSVMGQHFWYMLHGVQVPPLEITKRMVGHSHVLAPQLRSSATAHLVARRLLVKAAARMRRMGYWAGEVMLGARFVAGTGFGEAARVPSTQDTFTLLRAADSLWTRMTATHGPQPVKQVRVSLNALTETPGGNGDLFDRLPAAEEERHRRRISLSRLLDRLNRDYGRDTVTVGIQPPIQSNYAGTKIAFTRIPAREEFLE